MSVKFTAVRKEYGISPISTQYYYKIWYKCDNCSDTIWLYTDFEQFEQTKVGDKFILAKAT